MYKNTIKRLAACAAVAVALGAAGTAFATEVAADEAREAAQGWAALREALTGKERFAGAEIADVKTYEGKDGRGKFHVVSFAGGGFAVTSGDTEIAPILAYSEGGEFVASDENPLWTMLTRDVAGRTKRLAEDVLATKNTKSTKAGEDEELEYGVEEDEAAATGGTPVVPVNGQDARSPSAQWARLREAAKAPEPTGRPLLMAALPRVGSIATPIYGPLCETAWNQSNENGLTCYNYYTPSNYLCGCVATAMAQVMRKFKYPQEKVPLTAAHSGRFLDNVTTPGVVYTNTWHIGGTYGETWEYPGPAFGGPYDWANMVAAPRPDAQAGTLTEVQRQAIGLLCRDCGISVNMNYNIGGSGSDTGRIAARLVDTFGYKSAALRQNGNPISLTEQLDAYLPSFAIGSPCAVGISGHAIVADGYGLDSNGRPYVHYNYGWSYSAWYTPPDEEESDVEYPIVYKIVYNVMTPEAEYAAYDPGVCFVSGFVMGEDGETPVAGAAVMATDADSGSEVSGTTDGDGAFTLCLPPGYDYSLTAEKDGATAGKKLGAVMCSAEAVGNRRNVRLVLGIAAEDVPVELLHRWSFNGDTDAERLADTGRDALVASAATVCGTDADASVSFADGRVSLSGSGNGTGYLTLGANVIPDTATLEIWAREDAVKSWSRVFDYGIAYDDAKKEANNVFLSWTSGNDQRLDRFTAENAQASCNIDGTMAPYTPGTMYHIALTFEKDAIEGSTLVRIMRRDAKTGELQRMGSRTVANFAVSSIQDAVLYIGHSQYTSDADANATYDEVRVWRGALSDAQLTANAIAGPDVADLAEARQIASAFQPLSLSTPVGGHTATRRGRIAFGKSRGGKGITDIAWPKLPLSDYADDGVHDVSELNRAVGAGNSPADLAWSQLRYDGWVEVTEEQAGWWTINQQFDDYFLFAIDGDYAIFNHTYGALATSRVRVTEGWHRFTVICGDTYGGYGAQYELKDGDGNVVMLVPFTVSLNGGDEMAFTSDNFTFGPDSGLVTLAENTDWTALGAVTLSPGTVIDLNGHTLKAAGLAVDGVGGAVVTNTALQTGVLAIPDGATAAGVAVADEVKVWNGGDLKWIQESAETTEFTGRWSPSVAYDAATHKAELGGENVFTPATPSGGNVVTMTVTAAFDAVPNEEATPDATAQGAVWLGTNGNFQVWTRTGGAQSSATAGWLDVAAEGVTPQAGVDYTFRLVFDYAAKTYSVEVKTGSTGFTRLREINPVNPVQDFPLAASGTAISKVRFSGDGVLTSILGEYVVAEGFAADDEVLLKDNASVILDAAQAAWLNSCTGGKTAVGNAAAGLSAADFDRAYLLNLDIAGENSYAFEITGITVGAENVTVAVTLTRTGKIAQKINGSLRFYGAATLEAFANPALQPLSSEPISDADFSAGDTATATYPKFSGSTTNTFFKARIEDR